MYMEKLSILHTVSNAVLRAGLYTALVPYNPCSTNPYQGHGLVGSSCQHWVLLRWRRGATGSKPREAHAAEGSARWLVFLELLVFVLPSNNSGSVWLVLPSAEQTRVSKLGGSFDGTPNSSELGNRPVWHAFWLQGAAAERALSGGRRHCILVMIVIYTILCIYIYI